MALILETADSHRAAPSQADVIERLLAFTLERLSDAEIDGLNTPGRNTLFKALHSVKVCAVLRWGITPELRRLVELDLVDKELAEKVGDAAVAAGIECARCRLFNSAGRTPREIFKSFEVTLAELTHVLGLLYAFSPTDTECLATWSAYAFWSRFSRYTGEKFSEDGTDAENKRGDTKHGDRSGQAGVTLERPEQKRYGSAHSARMEGSFYMLAYGTRVVRVLSEVVFNWLGSEVDADFGFRDSPLHTGEEGRLGPADKAHQSLVALSEAVAKCPVLSTIFPKGGRWIRKGAESAPF